VKNRAAPPAPRLAEAGGASAAWQARHVAATCLLADTAAFDGPRVRRIRVVKREREFAKEAQLTAAA
jgi:hypothetical protein